MPKPQNNDVPEEFEEVGAEDMQTSSTKAAPAQDRSVMDFATAGIPGAVMGSDRPEDILPLAGQAVTEPFGPGAEAMGAGAGEAGRQAVRAIRGEGFSTEDIAKSTLATLATSGIMKGAEKAIFRKEFAAKALQEFGEQLGKMKKFLGDVGDADPMLHTPIDSILKPLKDGFDKVKVPFGQESTILRKWISVFEKAKAGGSTVITPRTLIEMEDDLNNVVKFSQSLPSGGSIQASVKKKAINQLAKDMRHMVSGKVDLVAERAGLDEFKNVSQKISKIKERYPKIAPASADTFPGAARLATNAVTALGTGGASAYGFGPGKGMMVGAMTLALLDPAIRGALFKGVVQTGASTAGRIAASEGARRISKS